MAFCHWASAQRTISGTVTDQSANEPLIGANILVPGTGTGTTTDADGTYTLTIPDGATVLEFSYIGFASQRIEIGPSNVINVQLSEGELLDEVVVIGYGTAKKSDLTGAAVKADIDAFREIPNTNVLQALQGSVPGLNVGATTTAGSSPSISIRGQNTLSSSAGDNEPLIVLDGIIYRGSLAELNPNNIASIDVLKDASSAAIYGSQSANGVILITTKKGIQSSKPVFSYSTQYSLQTPSNAIQPFDGAGYTKFLTDTYWREALLAPDYTTPDPDFELPVTRSAAIAANFRNGIETDWWNLLTGNGQIVNHNLSISQYQDKFNYFISGGYTDQQGFMINDEFRRYNGQINLGFTVSPWLSLGTETSLAVADYSGFSPNTNSAFHFLPYAPLREANGEYVVQPDPTFLNPFLEIQKDEKDKRFNLFANIHADFKIPPIKGFNYRINYGQNYRTQDRIYFDPWGSNFTADGGFSFNTRYDWTLDNIFSYSRTFNEKHNLTLTALYGVESRLFSDKSAGAQNFQNPTLGFDRLQAGDPSLNSISTNREKETSLYTMGRLFYDYGNKYLLTATIRRDGYSGFGEQNKFGVFPSLALGWVISEENFLKNSNNSIDFLKLRASYGVTARRGLSRYETLATVSSQPIIVFGDGGNTTFGQWISSLANSSLTWETTTGLNLGLDFGIAGSRLYGNIEYYTNDTRDILYNIQIPNVTGFGSIATNIGQVSNHGLEVSLTGRVISNEKFRWTSTVNYSRYRNKIETILGFDNDNDGVEDDLIANRLFIGEPQSVIFDYQTDGLWQLADEEAGIIPNGFLPGTYKIVDQDGDGVITPNDRDILGYQDPAYRISWANTFEFGKLSLFVFVNSIQGGNNYYYGSHNPQTGRLEKLDQITYSNGFAFDYWTPSNPNAEYRRLDAPSAFAPGRYRQRNFVRLQDVSLAYDLTSALSSLNVRSLKLFVSGKNLLTITKWDGWDPEIGGNPGSGLPVLRNYAVGFNLEF